MRFIPTKFHAPLDYIVGVALIAAPWIFQFSDVTAATVVSIVLGVGLIAYSLITDYELGVWKVAPMAVHNLIDVAAGLFLAASPWIFGFADESRQRLGAARGGRPRRRLPRADDRAEGRLLVPQEHDADDGRRLARTRRRRARPDRSLALSLSVRHRPLDVADVEQADLALVDRRERVRDERVEARLVDLDVEDAAAAGRHGHRLHVVQRVARDSCRRTGRRC